MGRAGLRRAGSRRVGPQDGREVLATLRLPMVARRVQPISSARGAPRTHRHLGTSERAVHGEVVAPPHRPSILDTPLDLASLNHDPVPSPNRITDHALRPHPIVLI